MDKQMIESIANELITELGLTGHIFAAFELQNSLTWCVDFSIEGEISRVCGDLEPGMTRESLKEGMKERLLAQLRAARPSDQR